MGLENHLRNCKPNPAGVGMCDVRESLSLNVKKSWNLERDCFAKLRENSCPCVRIQHATLCKSLACEASTRPFARALQPLRAKQTQGMELVRAKHARHAELASFASLCTVPKVVLNSHARHRNSRNEFAPCQGSNSEFVRK